MLEAEIVEDVQGLLEGYKLKRMVPCKVDYALVDSKGPNRTSNWKYLMCRFVSLQISVIREWPFHGSVEGLWNSAYPVNQEPIPHFRQKWVAVKYSTHEITLILPPVRRCN